MEKLKIIDLLNRIALNQIVPKRIRYYTKIYEFDKSSKDYFSKNSYLFAKLFSKNVNFLNDEVVVLSYEKES